MHDMIYPTLMLINKQTKKVHAEYLDIVNTV